MKKLFSVLLFAALVASMVSCGGASKKPGQQNSAGAPSAAASVAAPESSGIDVDKSVLTVTVTFPAEMLESFLGAGNSDGGQSIEKYVESAKGKEGVEDATINPDGSVSLVMTKAAHEKMLSEYKTSLESSVTKFTDGSTTPSIKKIEYTSDVSVFNITVDKAAYEGSLDSMVNFVLGASGMFYRTFDGGEPQTVTIHIIDEATGDIFSTSVYPEALKD